MPDGRKLEVLCALVAAANESRQVAIDFWGRETDEEHFLIPRGLWNSLVRAAEDA